jgi:hypothetical protein
MNNEQQFLDEARKELNQHPLFQKATDESKEWMCQLYAYARKSHHAGLRAPGKASIALEPNYVAFENVRAKKLGFYVSLYREQKAYAGILDARETAEIQFKPPRPGQCRVDVTNAKQLESVKRLMDRAWQLKGG